MTKSLKKINHELARMLLQRMFVIDPDERIDIDGVLNHGFFHENLVIRK